MNEHHELMPLVYDELRRIAARYISRERPAGSDNCVRGVVKEIAYLGDVSVFLVRIDSGRIVRVTRPNIVRHADDRISWDEPVFLSWHASSPIVLTQ